MNTKNTTKLELLRFLIIGSINTLFSYSLFCFFIAIKTPHVLAISLAYVCGVTFNFQTIGRFVFKSHNNRLIFKFTLVYLLLYVINLGTIELTNHFIANWYLSGGITSIFCAAISFILNKYWVFKKSC
jgi:putative flippase GtrA